MKYPSAKHVKSYGRAHRVSCPFYSLLPEGNWQIIFRNVVSEVSFFVGQCNPVRVEVFCVAPHAYQSC